MGYRKRELDGAKEYTSLARQDLPLPRLEPTEGPEGMLVGVGSRLDPLLARGFRNNGNPNYIIATFEIEA